MRTVGILKRGLVRGVLFAFGLIMLAGCVYPIVDTRSGQVGGSIIEDPANVELIYTITPLTVLTDTTIAEMAFVLTSSDVISALSSSGSSLPSVDYPGALIPYDIFVDSHQLQDGLLWLPEELALPGSAIATITIDSSEPLQTSAAYVLELATMDPRLTYPSVVIHEQIDLDEPFRIRTIDSIGQFEPFCETCAVDDPPLCPLECRQPWGCFCWPFDVEAPE